MANVKKYDCKKICEGNGLTYLTEKNPFVWVKDEYGFTHKFDRTSLAKGSKPSTKSLVGDKTEYSIKMISLRHTNIHDYISFDMYEYISSLTYTEVKCKKHGAYKTKPNWLMTRGHHCMMCAEELRSKHKNLGTDEFVKRSKKHFGDTYDYSKVVYKDCRSSVTIVCKKHGEFSITAYCHSNGMQGCQKCGDENEKEHYVKRHNNGASVYFVKLTSKNDVFYKIGMSSNIKNRISELARESGCVVGLIHSTKYLNAADAWDAENVLLEEFKNELFTPNPPFKGYTECFKLRNISDVLKVMKSI